MIEREYRNRCLVPTDINQHLPALRALAEQCESVVELGTRSGNSTVAFLAGKPALLRSIDLSFSRLSMDLFNHVAGHWPTRWSLMPGDTLGMEAADIPLCDLLFIDTLHTADQIRHELTFAPRARKFIAIHDTVKYWKVGEPAEDGTPRAGIGLPILAFLDSAEGQHWRVSDVYHVNNGLIVLAREGS